MLQRLTMVAMAVSVMACGSATAPRAPKPDPFIAVRVQDQLDTTTAFGRADWHVFALLSGPYVNQNGVANEGDVAMFHRRAGHNRLCIGVEADSVGQRLLSLLAVADTSTEQQTDYTTALSIATSWFGGNHTLPLHWVAISSPPSDAWLSAQYLAGHGLTRDDPIKWSWDLSNVGTATFTERSDSDSFCSGA